MKTLFRLVALLLCAVMALAHTVTLTWTASTSIVSGYNMYRGTISGGPYTKINSSLVFGTTYTDGTPVNGQTYYYTATAVNSTGQESIKSTQTTAVIPGPKINAFTANPVSITAGTSSTLTISTTNATGCSINQGVGPVSCNGTVLVSPSVSTTYLLTVTDGSVTTTASVTVAVTAVVSPPSITAFTATPSSISQGTSSTLSFTVTGGTTCSIDQGIGPLLSCNGSQVVTPTVTTTYTLTATNSAGSVTKQVTVTVTLPKPVITSFTATPSQLFAGQSTTLNWSVTGSTSLSIDQGIGTVTGLTSKIVSNITASKTFTLTATNANGSVTKSTTVTLLVSCSGP